MKKLLHANGESVAEAVIAIALIAVVFLFLAEAVAGAARVNARADTADISLILPGEAQEEEYSVALGGDTVTAVLYRTENGYYYYEPKEGGG